MQIDKLPFFKGYQTPETAVIDVRAFQEWAEAQGVEESQEGERDDTAYLLANPAMRERLLAAMQRTGGMSLEDVKRELGI